VSKDQDQELDLGEDEDRLDCPDQHEDQDMDR
jgi:hypothetical protein